MSSPMRMRTSGQRFPLTREASSGSNPVPAGIPDVHTHEMMMCVRDTPVFSREHHSGRHADSGARAVGLMTVELLARLGWAAFSLASPNLRLPLPRCPPLRILLIPQCVLPRPGLLKRGRGQRTSTSSSRLPSHFLYFASTFCYK